MQFGTRWQRVQTYASLGAWYTMAIHEDGEFTFKDFPETAVLGMQLGLIWSPQIALGLGMSATPLNIVEGAALAGLGISYAIGGREGAETYIDYITDPGDIVKNPQKAEALMQANRIVMAGVTMGGSELARAGVNVLKDFKNEIFKNRFVTGPYLPF